MLRLTQLLTYPIKSTKGTNLSTSLITNRGLLHDRHWVMLNAENEAITARTHPSLLRLHPHIQEGGLKIYLEQKEALFVPQPSDNQENTALKLFSIFTSGLVAGSAVNQWLSDYLKEPVKLVFMGKNDLREVQAKHGGKPEDVVSYADEAPILLTNQASLADLNSKLAQAVSMTNFRPNLVIEGAAAFAEDGWKHLRIGNCEFEVAQRCQRCVFTTIDPETQEKNPQGEPLRTLSTYRKTAKGGIGFGVHLIPRKLGSIKVGDEVIVG